MSYEIEIDGKKITISEEDLKRQMSKRAKPSSVYKPEMQNLFDPEQTYQKMLTNIGFSMYMNLQDYEIYHRKYLGFDYILPEEHDTLTTLPLFSPSVDWQAERERVEAESKRIQSEDEEVLDPLGEFDQNCIDYKEYMQNLALERAKQNLDEKSKIKVMEIAKAEVAELKEEAEDRVELYKKYTASKCEEMLRKYTEKFEKETKIVDNYEEILEELADELANDPQPDTLQMFQSYYYNYTRSLKKLEKLTSLIIDFTRMKEYARI